MDGPGGDERPAWWQRLARDLVGARGRGPVTLAAAASAGIHVLLALLVSFPRPSPDMLADGPTVLREIALPPTVRVPSSPSPIRRPPDPEAPAVEVDETVAAAGTPVPAPPSGPAPRPPDVSPVAPGERPTIAQADVPPLMEARDELRARLRREYPDRLRQLRRGGVVELQFYIDDRGDVARVEVAESSGHPRLDRAAADITGEVTFLPAMVRDRAVGIWVRQRICFVFIGEREEVPTPEECEQRVALGRR